MEVGSGLTTGVGPGVTAGTGLEAGVRSVTGMCFLSPSVSC